MRYVAFLRGINLGNRRISMSRLRELFEQLDFENVETFIASGNVIFSADAKSQPQLESSISAHLQKSLGYEVDTFIRTNAEVQKIAASKPFPAERAPEAKVHVVFLHAKLPVALARQLESIHTDYDAFHVDGSEFYWLTRGPISQSKVWTLPEVKQIKPPTSTMRNMTTIKKLAAKLV